MKKFDKWVMPDDEEHLPGWMTTVQRRVDGRLTYQYGKYEQAMKLVGKTRVAIDVGSHIGLWAYFMARDFDTVVCFEPLPRHIACWHENMKDRNNAVLISCALGADSGVVELETRTKGSSGDTQIVPGPPGAYATVEMKRLDSFDFKEVDFIKIDCEGYEEFVLRGGVELLKEWKPVVVVEQKRDMSKRYGCTTKSAVDFLESLGARQRLEISGDFIMSW